MCSSGDASQQPSAGGKPEGAGSAGLRSFVATNSFTFTREDDLFAAAQLART